MGEFKDWLFKVKTLKCGQPRPYADSEYEYEIVSELPERYVKSFCINILRPCKQTYDEWDKRNADSYFHGYYRFEKIAENTYKYFKLEPFCD